MYEMLDLTPLTTIDKITECKEHRAPYFTNYLLLASETQFKEEYHMALNHFKFKHRYCTSVVSPLLENQEDLGILAIEAYKTSHGDMAIILYDTNNIIIMPFANLSSVEKYNSVEDMFDDKKNW